MNAPEKLVSNIRKAFSDTLTIDLEHNFWESVLKRLGFAMQRRTFRVSMTDIQLEDFETINPLKLNNEEISKVLPFALVACLETQDKHEGIPFLHDYIWPLFNSNRASGFEGLTNTQRAVVWHAIEFYFENLQDVGTDSFWLAHKGQLQKNICG